MSRLTRLAMVVVGLLIAVLLMIAPGLANAATPTSSDTANADAAPVTVSNLSAGNSSRFLLCMSSSASHCMTTHGRGNDVTIENPNATRFHLKYLSHTRYEIVDGSGDCLRVNSQHHVYPQACNSGDHSELWHITTSADSNRVTLKNVGQGYFAGTWGPQSGDKVYGRAPEKNFYTGWVLFAP